MSIHHYHNPAPKPSMSAIKQTPVEIKATHQIPDSGPQFSEVLAKNQLRLRRDTPSELQINVGKLCNLACHHCHVDAGPKRTELMTWDTMQKILDWIDISQIKKVDLTGGAPELNPHFRKFCDELINRDIAITSRCNITVLFEPKQEDLATWYANNRIRLVCSLPCYTEDNVDAQRGKGVFDDSIRGLQLLNSLGYGIDQHLTLDLVYNPGGAFLPPTQDSLERDYRQMLGEQFGIQFSSLLAITNIPINRFAHALRRDGKLVEYQRLLVDNFNPETIDGLMCRHTINLDWHGQVFDCDFNQMLGMPMGNRKPRFLWDIPIQDITHQHIAVDRHCFACTAGAGSSCGGSLAE